MAPSRLPSTRTSASASPPRRRGVMGAVIAAVLALVISGLSAPAAFASSVNAAVFSGPAGATVVVDSKLVTRPGVPLTLTVTTSNDTKCVAVSGSVTAKGVSDSAQSSWSFNVGSAGTTEGMRPVTVAASSNFNKNTEECNGNTEAIQTWYTVDNSAPVLVPTLQPAANAAGWNNTNTTVTWSASDAGAGVLSGPTNSPVTVSANGITTVNSAAIDRLGLSSTASVTVRVDKNAPTISASQIKNSDGTTTITFACADPKVGNAEASGVTSCIAEGSTTNSRTVGPSVTVTGTATDNAGNKTTLTSTSPAGDTSAPTLSGAPTTPPNAAGWYSGDVTIRWTAEDPESGIPILPTDTIITGEGDNLTSTLTVTNGVGLSTTATSSPAVKIDRTKPITTILGASNTWKNGAVAISLTANDSLSGVARTEYKVDGGEVQQGAGFSLENDGDHTVAYRSIDAAGNEEAWETATVRIDRTAPIIGHTFQPLDYKDGVWTNMDVTVTFICTDQGGSEVVECTAPVDTSTEGTTSVVGTVKDGAGNSATDTATVRIDKTKPELLVKTSGVANDAGWYKESVTVTYTTSDALSGVTGSPDSQLIGEGADQSRSASVTDAAGNSTTAGVTGINVDLTQPTLEATPSTDWSTGDVTVKWICTDGLSGVAVAPGDTVVGGEGANLSATASCTDIAGNSVTKTVEGIRIDRSAPTTMADAADPLPSGWHGKPVTVTLDAHDNLSGVATTQYTVNGGDPKAYTEAFTIDADGVYSIEFWSTDAAGNVEKPGAPLTVKVDTTAPTTEVTNPVSPDSGWFVTSGIPFAFEASDAGSGIAGIYYTIDGGETETYGEPFIENLSTGTHEVTYWSVDNAGNAETKRTFAINVDTIAPTITGKASPEPNEFGWNNTDVEVTFDCADVGSGVRSGIAGCAGATTLVNDGDDQMVRGEAVDIAGNKTPTTFGPVRIDTVRPTLTGVPDAPNAAGWYRDDVQVKWVGDDGLSGIAASSQLEDSLITGEGENLGVGPVTISDRAGNISDPASVTGVNIDRTAPVVKGKPRTAANEAGWHNAEVTVDFVCTDNLSGIALCPTNKVLSGDGVDKSVASGPARDVAGNVTAGTTVTGINIDGTAPMTLSNNKCTAVNGWCTGTTADVVLTASDQEGLSGVKEIRYRVDEGALQSAAGNSVTVSVELSETGSAVVTYYAVDNAGNLEDPNKVSLQWDNIAPTVSHTLSPAPNAAEWNKTDVTVTFDAKDDDKGSGVSSVTAPVIVSEETSGLVVIGTATDKAGNVGTDDVTVRVDKTAPTLAGTITSGLLGNGGWYVSPVTVTFTCSDSLSGLTASACPDPMILSANGTNNSASGKVLDKAGNDATVAVGGIKIDSEKPMLTQADVNVQDQTYKLGSTPVATCSARDAVSGVAGCTVSVTGGNANGVGTFTYTAVATDNAGNTTTVTGSYKVTYRFDGFLQPINDTAHQVGVSTSIFKAGSTVPVKFQLKDASGRVVQPTAAPVWLTPVKGSATSAPVDESVYSATADSGSAFRYDATAQQYIYNWKTGNSGGNYWRIGVRLDDGQVHYVNIGLR